MTGHFRLSLFVIKENSLGSLRITGMNHIARPAAQKNALDEKKASHCKVRRSNKDQEIGRVFEKKLRQPAGKRVNERAKLIEIFSRKEII